MIYEDLYDKIRSTGLIPSLVVKNGNVLAIEVYSPAIQLDTRVNILKEVCGNEFSVQPFFNEEIISIKKKP